MAIYLPIFIFISMFVYKSLIGLNRYLRLCCLTLICVFFTAYSYSNFASSEKKHTLQVQSHKDLQADSIMRHVIDNSSHYASEISQYTSESYIKGQTSILKRNFLLLFAHNIIPVNRRRTDMLFEIICNTDYNSPNSYTHNILAINGNSLPNKEKCMEAIQFLSFNVYNPTASNEALLFPTAPNAFNYYDFKLLGTEFNKGEKVYIIEFKPKRLSRNQLSGTFHIIDKTFMFKHIDFRGKHLFADFKIELKYEDIGAGQLMPVIGNLFLKYNLLGNEITSKFHLNRKYTRVDLCMDKSLMNLHDYSYDLTRYNKVIADTLPVIADTTYWNSKRDIPLTPEEKELFTPIETEQSTSNKKGERSPDIKKYINMTEALVSTLNFGNQNTRVKYSGIINPFQFAYSGRNGITYKQRVRIYHTFKNGQAIQLSPEIGVIFKHKEIYWKAPLRWEYKPEKMAYIQLEVGNRNNSYTSEITNKINSLLKDSTFKFDDLNLKYYSDDYIELKNNIELFNGFQFYQGLSYHRRKPVKRGRDKVVNDELTDLINDEYNAFLPYFGITYTPRQYYWMDGRKKIYLYSKFPTINIEYARSIDGVMKSNSSYERIEARINQKIPLGLLRNINYYVSGGFFTRQKSVYFADFNYFTPKHFPDSWDEEIGGRFYSLKREWYNAATSYAQAHIMYESPFLVARLLNSGRYLMNERLYFSHLWTSALKSYSEIGYGFGNHIFNIAFFCGFDHLKATKISMRFAFEL